MTIRSVRIISTTKYPKISTAEQAMAAIHREESAILGLIQYLVRPSRVATTASMYLASFSHPSIKINKYLDILYEFYERVDVLHGVHTTLVFSFEQHKDTGESWATPLIKRVHRFLLSAQQKVDRAIENLSKIAQKHQPNFFRTCCTQIVTKLAVGYRGNFKEFDVISLVRVITRDNKPIATQFTNYLTFKKFKDRNNFVHENYYIAFSCLVDLNGRYSMNYALMPTLRLPGKFKAVDTFGSSLDGYSSVVNHLKEEGFSVGVKHG